MHEGRKTALHNQCNNMQFNLSFAGRFTLVSCMALSLSTLRWFGRCGRLLRVATAGVLSVASGLAAVVRVVEQDEGWALTRDGSPYVIKGVGGHADLVLAKRLGATTVRTWGADQLEPKVGEAPLLDRVAEQGLTAMAGLWIGHERHGFDYGDQAQVARQREAVRSTVRKHRAHPALLVWGLGNEMEGPPGAESSRRIFRELEELAKIIKEEDPDHPVCMVVAVGERAEVEQIRELVPSIDVLGVNAYGSAPGLGAALVEAGWTKPFILAEFGPLGHWEVAQAPWGAPIEPTSAAKAARYAATHEQVLRDGRGRCVGTFAFVWGAKQETTGTWYGMFLRSGEKLPSVDAMARVWGGRWPENRCPSIESLESAARLAKVAPGSRQRARARITDPEGDAWKAEWFVMEESRDRREGGDREAEPPRVEGGEMRAEGGELEFLAPTRPGAYRLFLVVRDGRGGASAENLPFFVESPVPTP